MNNSKILIVNDRPEKIIAIESILNEPHRTFINATSGIEAMLMTKVDQVDLIILDNDFEDLTANEVAQELRKNETTKNIPIIFITARTKNEIKNLNKFKMGTVDFLYQPFDMEEMKTKVAIFVKFALQESKWKEKASI